ncbi:MAG TPA: hypothetical protein VH540_28165 [Ktedonobacterales bacterium]
MRSYRSKQFDKLLAALPADAQRQAKQAYQQFKKNPRYPGLQFKPIDERNPPTYSARVGAHYRAGAFLMAMRSFGSG